VGVELLYCSLFTIVQACDELDNAGISRYAYSGRVSANAAFARDTMYEQSADDRVMHQILY
jgi:hypothetical protein